MPEAAARLRYLRVSPFKVRPVLDLVRGKDVTEAREILAFSTRGPARYVAKLLDSAIANAEHNEHLPVDELYVSAAFADEGPTLKRFRPRARGRATRIRKRTSHITIVVSRYSEQELRRRAEREATSGGAGDRRRRALRRRRVVASVAAQAPAGEEAPAGEQAPAGEATGKEATGHGTPAATPDAAPEGGTEASGAGGASIGDAAGDEPEVSADAAPDSDRTGD